MKYSIFISLILIATFAFAQKNQSEKEKAFNQINIYGDVYFKFDISESAEIFKLPNFISIDNVKGNTIYAYVHEKNYQKLLQLNIPFEVVPKTSGTEELNLDTTTAEIANKLISQTEMAAYQINTYGDVYFKFDVSDRTEVSGLPKFISIDNVKGNTVYAYVHKKNYQKLLQLNIPYEVVPKKSGTEGLTMATTIEEMANWDRYPTYPLYLQMMQKYATKYPSICRLDTIGTSQLGRLLLVLKITDNPDIDEDEPEVFYTAQMHGDELVGGVLYLRLIDYLLTNYGTNTDLTNLVNNVELWINPYANPDGTYHGGDETVSGASRYYYSGDDPNRNFPSPVRGQHPDDSYWNQETVAMMNFGAAHNFVMSMNTHSGAEVVNFPWDCWSSAQNTHADDDWWQFVSHEYADTVFAYGAEGYMTGVSSNGITEGADWYYAYGSRQDYYTYYLLGREVTLELSNTKLLDAAQLPNHWNYNYRSFINYIRQATYGIHGIITDSCTGQPIKAKVFVNAHDRDNSHTYSALPLGDYHRPIYAGNYSITYSAFGYKPHTVNNLTITNKSMLTQYIQLTPDVPIADFISDATSNGNTTIQFTNRSQASSGSTFLWDFGDGQTSTNENPSHTYADNGIYTVTLTVNNCSGSDIVTQNIAIIPSSIWDTEADVPNVYPNPSSGTIYIEVPAFKTDIYITDLSGRILWQKEVNRKERLEINGLNNGIYQVIMFKEKTLLFNTNIIIAK